MIDCPKSEKLTINIKPYRYFNHQHQTISIFQPSTSNHIDISNIKCNRLWKIRHQKQSIVENPTSKTIDSRKPDIKTIDSRKPDIKNNRYSYFLTDPYPYNKLHPNRSPKSSRSHAITVCRRMDEGRKGRGRLPHVKERLET